MLDNPVVLVPVASLSAIEGFGPKRAIWLQNKIVEENIWTVPLKVEKTKHLVMDGHHRFEVAKALGLKHVPAQMFSYDEVEVYSLREKITVTGDIILKNHEEGIIFPYKTAKHNFPNVDEDFEGIPLNELK